MTRCAFCHTTVVQAADGAWRTADPTGPGRKCDAGAKLGGTGSHEVNPNPTERQL